MGKMGNTSRTLAAVLGCEPQRYSTGQSCFRFLVPLSKVKAHPVVGPFFDGLNLEGQEVFTSSDRRLVIYPCRSGTLLNVGGLHPTSDRVPSAGGSQFQATGQLGHLLETYKDFRPEILEFLKLAEDIKLWELDSRDPPLTFHKGKLALLGDAAHPTLPHLGQGGAQAIEDAAALGALFPAETEPYEVTERLAMYNRVRYDHSVTVMFMSRTSDNLRERMMDSLRKFVPDATLPKNMFSYTWDSYPLRDARMELDHVNSVGGITEKL